VNILERIIDATDQILGRLSSRIAKSLMKGEKIIVINAKKTIITGNPENIIEKFRIKTRRGDPHHGPYYPKTPDRIFKRSVRGMIPYKKSKGRKALERLIVYSSNPQNLKGEQIAKTKNQIKCKYVSLEEITKKLKGF